MHGLSANHTSITKFPPRIWFLFLAMLAIILLSGAQPYLPPWPVPPADRYRLFCVAILITAAGMTCISACTGSTSKLRLGKLVTTGLAAFTFLGVLSSLQAPLPRYALLEWAQFIGSGILGLGVFQAIQERGGVKAVTELNKVIFFAVCAYSLYYLFWYFTRIECLRTYCVQLRLPGFDNPRTFDAVFLPLLLLYPLTIHYLPNRPLIRVTYWLLGSAWFSLLFVSGARTSYLTIAAVTLLAICLAPRTALPWLKRFALFLLLGGIAYWVLHGWWPSLWLNEAGPVVQSITTGQPQILDTGSTHARTELWRRAAEIFRAHPWLGAGPMHYAFYGDIPHINEGAHPHNLSFQLLAEWGWICTGLFYVNVLHLFGKSLIHFRLHQNKPVNTDQVSHLVIFMTWCAMLIATQAAATNLLVLAGLSATLIALIPPKKENTPQHLPYIWPIALFVVSLCTISLLLNGIYPEAVCRLEEETVYRNQYPGEKTWPRFWGQGKIAFTNSYLPQCQRDANRLFASWGWNSSKSSPLPSQ